MDYSEDSEETYNSDYDNEDNENCSNCDGYRSLYLDEETFNKKCLNCDFIDHIWYNRKIDYNNLNEVQIKNKYNLKIENHPGYIFDNHVLYNKLQKLSNKIKQYNQLKNPKPKVYLGIFKRKQKEKSPIKYTNEEKNLFKYINKENGVINFDLLIDEEMMIGDKHEDALAEILQNGGELCRFEKTEDEIEKIVKNENIRMNVLIGENKFLGFIFYEEKNKYIYIHLICTIGTNDFPLRKNIPIAAILLKNIEKYALKKNNVGLRADIKPVYLNFFKNANWKKYQSSQKMLENLLLKNKNEKSIAKNIGEFIGDENDLIKIYKNLLKNGGGKKRKSKKQSKKACKKSCKKACCKKACKKSCKKACCKKINKCRKILQSGNRKGKRCNRLNCQYH
jgi:hypothetical protein